MWFRRNKLKRLEGQRAVINTKDGQALAGVVAHVQRDKTVWFEPGTAEYLDKAKEAMSGHIWVPGENVAFGQVP